MTAALAKRKVDGTLISTLIASSGLLSILVSSAQAPVLARAADKETRPAAGATKTEDKNQFQGSGSGTLLAMLSTGKELGQCPLKHTSVSAKISGYVARVTVKQTFANPYKDKIETVYTFPLSETGAVDDMVMKVGTRTIHGTIKKREEARQIYEIAKAQGHVASLLDQERPNIFTQSVANIEPGKEVEITLQYIDILPYEDGKYSFAFPTVVGPRFIPGGAVGKTGTGWAPDTNLVPDASRITPPVTPKGTRAGHDISINVDIDAGVPISNVRSALHEVSINSPNNHSASVTLVNQQTIPNKDFVLTWDVAGDAIKSGYLTYRDPKESKSGSGYFTLMLLPPKHVTPETVAPKEMIFLIDCSGSQHGLPLEKAKETLTYIVDHMNPQDTFQIVSFNNTTSFLFDKPKQSTNEMRARARTYISGLQANGGTWMAPAVEQVCAHPADANRLRIVTFMTDGYVGNDMEVLGLIKKLRGKSRWFAFGTGNSVNRFLIDGIAKEGGGEADYVLLNSPAGQVGKKFYDRISSPVLTDVKVSFEGVDVKEVFPKEVSDVWAQKPLYIKGRYLKPGAGTVTLTGFHAGKPYKQTLKVNFPETDATNSGIASIWARAKVDRLMSEDWFGAQNGHPNKEIKDEIVQTALDHHIMSQYTSFVAVEEKTVTKGGKPTLMTVPVEMPEGVSREHVFEDEIPAAPQPMAMSRSNGMLMGKMYAPKAAFFSPGAFAGSGGGFSTHIKQNELHKARFYNAPMPATTVDSALVVRDFRAQKPIRAEEATGGPVPLPAKEERKSSNKKDFDKEMDASAGKLDQRLQGLDEKVRHAEGTISGLTIKAGKVSIKITLNEGGDKVLTLLKKAGLEDASGINLEGSKLTVTGKISIKKLNALAKLSQVTFIAPAN